MTTQSFDNVWDAICDSPEEAALMTARSWLAMNLTDNKSGIEWPEEVLAVADELAEFLLVANTEYAIEHQHAPGGLWHRVTDWARRNPLNPGHVIAPDERYVKRHSTAPKVVEIPPRQHP